MSTAAALDGSIAAFDGRTLHVRSAGEEAWLCRIAPATPEEEAEAAGQGALLAGDELELWSGAAAVGGVDSGALQVRALACFSNQRGVLHVAAFTDCSR